MLPDLPTLHMSGGELLYLTKPAAVHLGLQKAKSKRKKNPLTGAVPVSQNIAILWS